MTMPGKRKRHPVLHLRRVFVHSAARAQAAVTSRAKKLDRARDDLERLGRGLGSRQPPLPRRRDVTTRITAISRVRKVGAYLRTAVGTDPETGKPTLAWHYDEHALATEAATDGWYALLTNLPPEITAAEVLRRYKRQETVERRYSAVKGPSPSHRCSSTTTGVSQR
jgi:hypothetical protein